MVLVTGGAGFIGSHCATYYYLSLIVSCALIICLQDQKKNIAKLLTRKDFTFIQHDVTRDYLSWDG